MRRVGTRLVAAALGLALAAAQAAAQDKSCKLQTVGELDVVTQGQSLLVKAQINGMPIKMIVDTGSDATVLFQDSVTRMGLPYRRLEGVRSFGLGGQSAVNSVHAADFRVGSLVEFNANLLVTGRGDGVAQGLLGVKFLTQSDVEFDLAHGKVRFFRPGGCTGDQVVYWGEPYAVAPLVPNPDGALLVRVRINDTPILATLDSGMSFSAVTPGVAARAGVETLAGPHVALRGLGRQDVPTQLGRFSAFSFGEETIRNSTLGIADFFAADKEVPINSHIAVSPVEAPRMLLGADFLLSHRVYISMQQHMMYVSYEGGPVFRAPQAAVQAAKP